MGRSRYSPPYPILVRLPMAPVWQASAPHARYRVDHGKRSVMASIGPAAWRLGRSQDRKPWLQSLITPLASPHIAGLVAFIVYVARAALSPNHFRPTNVAYFNFIADAFLHGQLSLRIPTWNTVDLIQYGGATYAYWPPFPAILLAPLVALFGVGISDVAFTVVF